jgi:chemotaxis protein methyltransferase CheR
VRVADFELYKDLLYAESGLVLTPDKSYLLDSRLRPVARKWNYPSIEIMTLQLRALPDSDLIRDIIEAMATRETSFFRDGTPFRDFEDKILPALLKNRAGKKSIRIWCAGSSSGQEPYSLAMLLKEKSVQMKGWKIEILATDISSDVLEQAQRGIYSQFEIQNGLPVEYLMKYFEQINEKWRLRDDVRSMVRFGYFNLLNDMDQLGMFDVILCRNVLVCFDDATRAGILDRLAGCLAKDGFLLLGNNETGPESSGFHPYLDTRYLIRG